MVNAKSLKESGISIIVRQLQPYRKTLITLSAISIVSAVANALVPYLAGRLIDSLIAVHTSFFLLLGVWGVLKFIADSIDWKIAVMSKELDFISETDYVSRGFGKLLELPMRFHKNHKVGAIGDKISRAAGNLSNIISRVVVDLLPQFLSIGIALTIVFFIEYRLGIVLLVGLVVFALVLYRVAPRMAGAITKGHLAYQDAYGKAYDTIFNVEPIKHATSEEYEQHRLYRNLRLRVAPLLIRAAHLWQSLAFWQRVLITATQGIIFLLSFFLVREGAITVGELVAVNAYATMVFGPFVTLGRNWHAVQDGIASLKFSEAMLNTPPESYKPEKSVYVDRIKGEIAFQEVSFRYTTKQSWVLKNLSFRALPGEKIALVGRSGEGKTTMADLISCYYHTNKGKVLVDGIDIRRLNLKQLRASIAVVPQEVVLFDDTVKNNIRYGKWNATEKQVKEAAHLAHADEFIEKFSKKYDQVVGERGVKLSIGQKQRIAIARAILKDPAILVLDEPTSALDAQSEGIIQASLERLMEGRTTFIIAHRLSTVRKADRILVLEGGEIAEQGTHQELMQKESGAYRALYNLQFGEK